jgi:alpha-glucoside transport system permease protein
MTVAPTDGEERGRGTPFLLRLPGRALRSAGTYIAKRPTATVAWFRGGQWRSWAFVAPALALIGFFLVYPTVATMIRSFFGAGRSLFGPSVQFVGIENWKYVFTNNTMLSALRNNALWVALFTTCTVGIGLLLAVLLDRVRYERLIKSIIFIPSAISAVGISVIWKFIYAYRPPGVGQIGLLNAIVVGMGGEPVGWLIARPWINNICLIIVGVWMWTGFCMVILSAAYKNIPKPLLEAARIDGAGEWRVFRNVTLPLLAPTAAVVATTMVVQVLKMFAIVYVMTNGNYDTEVIANRMYKEAFNFGNYGRASTIAVVLLLLIIPFMVINIRRFVAQEGAR